jgi:hypothetical protein
MRSRLSSWILLLYVAIDLANPFVPGAFRFTPEGGLVWVEGASPSREEVGAGTSEARGSALPLRRTASDDSLLVSGKLARAGPLISWLVHVRTGDPPARDSPPLDSGDH